MKVSIMVSALAALFLELFVNLYAENINVKVLDDDGRPIPGIEVSASNRSGVKIDPRGWPDDAYNHGSALSDANGNAKILMPILVGRRVSLSVEATPVGCYASEGISISLVDSVYGSAEKPILYKFKKIRDPIPMYAACNSIQFPLVPGPWYYDLIKRDWLPPIGSGETPDWKISIRYDIEPRKSLFRDDTEIFDVSISIESPLDGCGFLPFEIDRNNDSVIKSPLVAPDIGYLKKIELRQWVNEGEKTQLERIGGLGINMSQEYGKSYIIKIASRNDNKRFYVGKVYRGFSNFIVRKKNRHLDFTYYINPNEGSRSLEWNGVSLFQNDVRRPSSP